MEVTVTGQDVDGVSRGRAGTGATDVVVVGAGLAGLAAAATAARAGARVVLVDSRSVGGRARSSERSGYLLNEGAHALYQGGPAAAVLRDLDVRVTGAAPPIDRYKTWWEGAVQPLPLTPTSLVTTKLLGARSKVVAGRLLGGMKTFARDLNGSSLTFGEWLDSRGARDDLRRLMTVVARITTYFADPLTLPADAVARQLALAARGGVHYLDGGWQTLVDGLCEAGKRAGVLLHEGATVTAITRDGTDWVVEAGGLAVAAPQLVVAVNGPAAAEAIVGRSVGWTDAAGPPVRAACLDIGLDHRPDVEYLFSADDPLYLSAHAPVARLAPDGHHLLCLLRYVGPGELVDRHSARDDLERHAARANLPSGDGREVDRFLAPMPVAWGSPTLGTSRPRGNELAGEGIHAAGDWVGDHLLADASLDSGATAGLAAARRAAQLV